MKGGEKIIINFAIAITTFVINFMIKAMLGDIQSIESWTQISITVLMSSLVFSNGVKVISELISRWNWLFKKIMGKSYVRGTWVGRIKTSDGSELLFFEQYDQTTSGLTIKGRSYRYRNSMHDAHWVTISAVVDPEGERIDCLYKINVLKNGKDNDCRHGTGRLRFTKQENGIVQRMDGIAVDEYKAAHLEYVIIERISDDLLDFESARKEVFERYGEYLLE